MTAWAMLFLAAALLVVPGRVSPLWRVWPAAMTAPQQDSDVLVDPLQIAGTYDLLAACVRAGLPMSAAARAVSSVAPGVVAQVLRRAADLLALGADPAAAWAAAAEHPATESLARMARRSARSGAPMASALSELAESARVGAEDAAAARAQRAGVLIGGPLGLCFLPAFVCLGIVPVVVGLAATTLGNGAL